MDITYGLDNRKGKDMVKYILDNLYGQKKAVRVGNEYLVSILKRIGFEQ